MRDHELEPLPTAAFPSLDWPGLAQDVLVWKKAFGVVQDTEGRPWLGAEVDLPLRRNNA
jgi:hypothetical protein